MEDHYVAAQTATNADVAKVEALLHIGQMLEQLIEMLGPFHQVLMEELEEEKKAAAGE